MAEDERLNDVSTQLLRGARDLKELEERKRLEARSTDRFHALAEDITDKARQIESVAALEESLGDDDSPSADERDEQQPGDWTDGR